MKAIYLRKNCPHCHALLDIDPEDVKGNNVTNCCVCHNDFEVDTKEMSARFKAKLDGERAKNGN